MQSVFLMPSGLGEPMDTINILQISPRGPQRNALGLKVRCLFGIPGEKGSPKVPGQPLGPNHLLHDGPNEAAAQHNGGHHQQVEVDQVEVLSGQRPGGHMGCFSTHRFFSYPLPPTAQSFPQRLSPFSDLHWPPADSGQEIT